MAKPKKKTMVLRCPKCTAKVTVARNVTEMPEHEHPDVFKTWAKVDGETQMFDIWKVCEWSGARIRIVPR